MIENLTTVVIDALVESKTNPRKTFDPAQERELVESIKAKGIVTPLLVRQVNEHLEIVDGARRYRAAKAAGLPAVPAIVRPYTDEEAYEVQLISFAQRVDIHPLDEAAAYEELRKKKFDIAQISAKVGKDRSYIAKRLQLGKLIEPVKEALRKEQITLGHALELARVDSTVQKELLGDCTDQFRPLTLAELREKISDEVLINLDTASFAKDDAKLLPKAGACTACPKRTGNSQDLFGDISKKGNHCLDGKCFNAKIDAFFELKKAQAEADGLELVRISDNYSSRKGSGAIGTEKYNVVAKKDATRQGIFIDGPNRGQIVPIRMAGEKQTSEGDSSGPKGHLSKAEMNQRYKHRIEIWQNKIEQANRVLLYNKIILQVRWPLSRKEFELLLGNLFKRFDRAPIQMICESVGIKPPSVNRSDVQKWIEGIAKNLTDQQVCQVAIGAVLWDELIQDPGSRATDPDRFNAMLSVHKAVDEKAIRAKVTAEMLPKKPKPPKVEPPAKPKAKKAQKKGKK